MKRFLLTLLSLGLPTLSAMATLTPDPAQSAWYYPEDGSTLNFENLAPLGGVTGFKAYGQATFNGTGATFPPDRLILAYCGFPGPDGACSAGPTIFNSDPTFPFAEYDGTRLIFNANFSIATPDRPNDLIGYLITFRVDNGGTFDVIQQAGTTERTFNASGFFDMPVSPNGSGGFYSAYNWVVQMSFYRTLVDPVDPELGPAAYQVVIPQNSIDVTGQGAQGDVPEPGTFLLIGGGLLLLPLARRMRRG